MASSVIKKTMTAWKLKGEVTGATSITMPTDYNEILLVAKNGSNIVSAVHSKDDVQSSVQYERLGSYYGNAGYFAVAIEFTSTYAKLNSFYLSTTDVTASSTFRLYYR